MARTELFNRSSQRALPVWLPVVVAVLIVARVISSRYVKSDKDLVQWVPAERAAQLAASTRKPILYEFSAAWCGPCLRLEEDVFRDPQLAALINQKFIPVKVVDRQRETGTNPPVVARLQSEYAVRVFPTIVVAQGGKPPATVVGYPGAARFEDFLRGIR